MTPSIIVFILKSVICSGLLMTYYLLVLKNKKMHGFNRWYLLIAVVVSLLLPLVELDLYSVSHSKAANFPLLEVIGKGTAEEQVMRAGEVKPVAGNVASVIYLLVTGTMLLGLAARIVWVYFTRRKYGAVWMNGFWVVKGHFSNAPFSYLDMLFWDDKISMESDEGKRIVMHELVHIRQHHTLDKITMQAIIAWCWVNPFFWLIRKELWLQHEFIADDVAIADGDTDAFARMLLQGNYRSVFSSTINSFFYSPVKRRLMMLTKSKRTSHALIRRLLVLPLLLITIFIFSFSIDTNETGVVKAEQRITMVLDAAHGGQDAGGIGIDGQKEKDITLAVCKKLVSLSGEYNIRIITTRDEDVHYTLEERLHTSNSTDDAIFLSVHVKKGTATDVRGNSYELGVNPKSRNYSKSILLASSIASKLKIQKLPVEVIDRGSAYMIRENKHPALLIECGNLDDADNIALLSNEVRTEVLCRNILSGIVDYNARLVTK